MKRGEIFPVGKKFGRLTIVKFLRLTKYSHQLYLCQCGCGTYKEIARPALLSGRALSCGCLQRETIAKISTRHGATKNKRSVEWRFYQVWKGINQRCGNPNKKIF